MDKPRLTIKNLSKSYGEKTVLKDFSLAVNDSDRIAIMAPSGTGKTTLCDIICGLLPADSGSVLLGASDTTLARSFEVPRHIPFLSAMDNIRFIAKRPFKEMLAEEILTAMGLEGSTKASSLSGGMAVRLDLAKAVYTALTNEKCILILDEPFKGLDNEIKNSIITYLDKILQNNTIPFLIVTHNEEDAEKLKCRVVRL